jgi:hypothetical protein
MPSISAIVPWASIMARDTDITPMHETTMVEIVGGYRPAWGDHPELGVPTGVYVLAMNLGRVRSITTAEDDQIDWGRASEALLDAAHA